MKKIFSINLISYLRLNGHKEQAIGIADEPGDSGNVWFSFPETEEVAKSIREYKTGNVNVNLRDLTVQFREIKQKIREVREEK